MSLSADPDKMLPYMAFHFGLHCLPKYLFTSIMNANGKSAKRGSSVVRHLPLVLEVPGSIPARGEENFGVRTRFL